LKLVAVKGPTPPTDDLYDHSLITSVAAMRRVLARFTPPAARHLRAPKGSAATVGPPPSPATHQVAVPGDPREARHTLQNRDLDTGNVVQPGGYRLTDSTYAELLHRLTRNPRQPIPPGIKQDIQAFYSNLGLPITTKKDPKKWKTVLADLVTLKTMPTNPEPPTYPTYDEEEQEQP
jgi:hypothetical protein